MTKPTEAKTSWFDSPTPEGLVVHERVNEDGSLTVEEIGVRGQVLYEYSAFSLGDGGGFFWMVGENLDFLVRRLRECDLRPCPPTGKTSGACPGHVIDHIVPLKRGGADDPSSMQWQLRAVHP